MKFFLLFLISTLMIVVNGCGGGSSKKEETKKSEYADKVITIMPLGDSITFDDAHAYYTASGANKVPDGKRTAYRSFLAYDLNDAGVKYDFVGSRVAGYDITPKFDPDNEGHPDWTSKDISKHIYGFLVGHPADVILLHIGTNDKNGGSVYYTEKILNEIKRFDKQYQRKTKVFLALIINRWFWDTTIDKYNKNLKEMVLKRNDPNVILVDMSHLLSGEHHDYLENTHPNKQGYKKIADKWFKAIMDNLY